MLRERYERQNIFEEIGTVSLEMEPVLRQLDTLLENDAVFEAVKADLANRYERTRTMGRGSTPVEVILRMLVIKLVNSAKCGPLLRPNLGHQRETWESTMQGLEKAHCRGVWSSLFC